MRKNKEKKISYWPLGLVFAAPIAYSTKLLEMDNLQKLFFFIAAGFAVLYFVKKSDKPTVVNLDKKLLLLILVFPVTFLTSVLNGSSEMLLLQITALLPHITLILFTIIILTKLGEETFFKISSFAIVIVSTMFSFIGLLQVMSIEIIPLPQILLPGSTIGQRGFAAEYLVAAIPFFMISAKYIKIDYRALLFFAAIINIAFLYFTRSRSAFLISLALLLAVIIFYFFKKDKSEKVKSLIPIIGVFVIGFAISLIPPIKGERSDFGENISSVVNTDNKSNSLRLEFWNASVQMIESNPWIGIGLNKWSGFYPKYFGDDFTDGQIHFVYAIHAHNDFLELFAENGILSLIVYLSILLMMLYNLFKKIKLSENYFYVFLSAFSLIAMSFISFPMHKFSSYFFLSVSAGAALLTNQDKTTSIGFQSIRIRFVFISLFIVGIITSYIRLTSELSYIKAIEYRNGGDYKNMLVNLEEINLMLFPLEPTKQPVEYHLATANYRQRNFKKALQHSLSSEKLAPYNPMVLHITAGIYQSSREYGKAIVYYENMRKYFPNYIDPQVNLLIIYADQKDFEKAKYLYNELVEKSPENKRLLEIKSKYPHLFS